MINIPKNQRYKCSPFSVPKQFLQNVVEWEPPLPNSPKWLSDQEMSIWMYLPLLFLSVPLPLSCQCFLTYCEERNCYCTLSPIFLRHGLQKTFSLPHLQSILVSRNINSFQEFEELDESFKKEIQNTSSWF